MARYKAIGRMQFQKEAQDQIAKREEIALRRAMAKEEHELNKSLAQQKHDAEMAEIDARGEMQRRQLALERQKFQHQQTQDAAANTRLNAQSAADVAYKQAQTNATTQNAATAAQNANTAANESAARTTAMNEKRQEEKASELAGRYNSRYIAGIINDPDIPAGDNDTADANGKYGKLSLNGLMVAVIDKRTNDAISKFEARMKADGYTDNKASEATKKHTREEVTKGFNTDFSDRILQLENAAKNYIYNNPTATRADVDKYVKGLAKTVFADLTSEISINPTPAKKSGKK